MNLGSNRWEFKPEVGPSKKLGALVVETALGASLFTANDDFFGGRRREQDPIVTAQVHLIYRVPRRELAGAERELLRARAHQVDGVKQNGELSNSRLA